MITGEPLRGSWWSHPRAQLIFEVTELLKDDPDVLSTKLIAGKVTFVHKQLWSELVIIGKTRAEWQLGGMSSHARRLLKIVEAEGTIRTDRVPWPKSANAKPGEAASELEKRLLTVAHQIHTESGAHARTLETWEHWRRRIGFKPTKVLVEAAMKTFNDRLVNMNSKSGSKAKLPWWE